jgi:hypothetical protein
MSIYYYGKLIGTYDLKQKKLESTPTLVGDIIKSRSDWDIYKNTKPTFTVRHYQDA